MEIFLQSYSCPCYTRHLKSYHRGGGGYYENAHFVTSYVVVHNVPSLTDYCVTWNSQLVAIFVQTSSALQKINAFSNKSRFVLCQHFKLLDWLLNKLLSKQVLMFRRIYITNIRSTQTFGEKIKFCVTKITKV